MSLIQDHKRYGLNCFINMMIINENSIKRKGQITNSKEISIIVGSRIILFAGGDSLLTKCVMWLFRARTLVDIRLGWLDPMIKVLVFVYGLVIEQVQHTSKNHIDIIKV